MPNNSGIGYVKGDLLVLKVGLDFVQNVQVTLDKIELSINKSC